MGYATLAHAVYRQRITLFGYAYQINGQKEVSRRDSIRSRQVIDTKGKITPETLIRNGEKGN